MTKIIKAYIFRMYPTLSQKELLEKIDFEKKIYKFTMIFMILLPCLKFFNYCFGLDLNQAYILWIVLPILLITYISGVVLRKFRIDKFDFIIMGLIFMAFLSTLFAHDIAISVFGEVNRNEGFLTLLNYYLLFLNLKNIENIMYKKNIINCFLFLGIIEVIYAILQVYTNFSFIEHFRIIYMAEGFCGNPNFFGSYMAMQLSFVVTFYMFKKRKIYLFLSCFFFFGLCLSSSTGPFLGFVLAFLFLLIICFKKIYWKKILILLICFTSIFFFHDASVHYLYENVHKTPLKSRYVIKYDIMKMFGSEIPKYVYNRNNKNNSDTDLQETMVVDVFASGRLNLWKKLMPIAQENLLLGVGLDNLKVVYPRGGKYVYDKAHNIYLHTLITNGLIAFILYCSLCFILFIKGFFIKEIHGLSIYIVFIAYSIQGFTNISVIEVAPYFFIFLGILSSSTKKEH